MALSVRLEDEALLFGKTLFSYLFSSHPVFKDSSRLFDATQACAIFNDKIGDAVRYFSAFHSDFMQLKFKYDFPGFTKDNESFKKYLEELLDSVVNDSYKCPFLKVIIYSSLLMELIAFLCLRGITQYVYSCPHLWLYMFKFHSGVEFFQKGGWRALAIMAERIVENYNDQNISSILISHYKKERRSVLMDFVENISENPSFPNNFHYQHSVASGEQLNEGFEKLTCSTTESADSVKIASKNIFTESSKLASSTIECSNNVKVGSEFISAESSKLASSTAERRESVESGSEDISIESSISSGERTVIKSGSGKLCAIFSNDLIDILTSTSSQSIHLGEDIISEERNILKPTANETIKSENISNSSGDQATISKTTLLKSAPHADDIRPQLKGTIRTSSVTGKDSGDSRKILSKDKDKTTRLEQRKSLPQRNISLIGTENQTRAQKSNSEVKGKAKFPVATQNMSNKSSIASLNVQSRTPKSAPNKDFLSKSVDRRISVPTSSKPNENPIVKETPLKSVSAAAGVNRKEGSKEKTDKVHKPLKNTQSASGPKPNPRWK